LNIDNKLPLPILRYKSKPLSSVTVHLRIFNKQELILIKFFIDIASSVVNQNAKFQ